ncbi:head-tail connector protein [Pseudoxanthomonas indica]|uniref:Phage gp6-like head-tail connector protein n=1 Tax=Pseudoxanthomonas indica TaxID=428993 RepID=A0A1T5JC78_9GAMM|nr:hypothetical protein [Pseudoxanthomonas indica]GGD57836.1 hypothetical protein GCM10007235_32630 [Pseudoxanthomonas indica]SKC48882.1 phage conserved hypothetical protein, phiE125 gp8 family [Pseudoxanthomonas indica]
MRLRLITAPSDQVVTTAAARAQVNAYGTAQDAQLEAMIAAVVSGLDGYQGELGRALVEQEWELALDSFPPSAICLPLPPLLSVASVKYVDPDGVQQTMDPAGYTTEPGEHGFTMPVHGTCWPATRAQPLAVRVQFKAGYGTTGDKVPAAIRSAILLRVADLFENRESSIVGKSVAPNPTSDLLLFPFKLVRP